MTSNQVCQLYVLGLIFSQGHETELVLQSLGFGKPQDTTVLVRCLEALFFLMQGQGSDASLLKWTETIIEAFFLQLSVFGGQSTTEMQGELDYAQELIERIQKKIEEGQAQIELIETLGGQIDTIVE